MSYITNIEKETLENENFRKVLYTTKNMQLVVMNIKVDSEIGEEIHHLDQFLRIEKGEAKVILNDQEFGLRENGTVIVSAGTKHNVINIGKEDLKLYSIYATPEHKKGIIHPTKEDSMKDESDHFDGEVDA